MRNILVLTHGEFANGIKDSLKLITGVSSLNTLTISEDDTPKTIKEQIELFLENNKNSGEMIILTDIPGGSSTQFAFPYLKNYQNLYVVSELNLALLLEIVLSNEENTDKLLHTAIDNAKASLTYLNDLVKDK
ncbi:PTS sugar transporter subunit IIA [Pediococcus ethanolidurans]|uniref:PTS system, mannose-specific IIA component n=2 Tax=Pediococcus ethanolidurans TaxID=319653 RepID=A0A1H9KRV0_9LACO|nr:hypothetical protein [Pediococcus ethanolidurans]GEN94014.1 hypothetical protein PET01_00640 [Pediococcus ethanolidurans]SER01880.1 PTS system, mannose-specific IIA component [Pediococcus ethanolidurans]